MILVMLISSLVLKKYVPHIENNSILALILFPLYAIASLVAIFFGQARVKIVFTDDAFIHIWQKRYLLSRQKDVEIPWATINKYEFRDFRLAERFRIMYSKKCKYSIYRMIFIPFKDDRDKMISDFLQQLDEYQKNMQVQ